MKLILTFFAGVLAFVVVSTTFGVVNGQGLPIVACTDWSCTLGGPGAIGLCVDLTANPRQRCGCQNVPGEIPVRKYCRILWADSIEDPDFPGE